MNVKKELVVCYIDYITYFLTLCIFKNLNEKIQTNKKAMFR